MSLIKKHNPFQSDMEQPMREPISTLASEPAKEVPKQESPKLVVGADSEKELVEDEAVKDEPTADELDDEEAEENQAQD